MARRHVREGELHLANQRNLVTWLRQRGHPTDEAERLLFNLEDLQRLHQDHVARLTGGL
jgi:hypothetical protein